jgi:hypothetical protein
VLGLNNNEPMEIVEAFANTFGLTFPILLDAGEAYGEYAQSPAVSPYPLDYVIDQSGQVAYFNSEYDPDVMVAVIDQLLGNAALMTIDPTSLDFGSVGVGITEHIFVELANNGSGELRLHDIFTTGGPFTVNLAELIVPPGGTRTLRVSFLPDQIGPAVGSLVLESNDSVLPFLQVPLYGEGADVSSIGHAEAQSQTVQLASWPNPFNPRVNIEFILISDGPVQLQVFDLRGMLMRSLLDEDLPAGSHHLLFDGRDDAGRKLATGEYFAVLKTVQGVLRQKMVLMR